MAVSSVAAPTGSPCGRPTRRVPGTIVDYLRATLAARTVDGPALPFGFTGGYAGYSGHEPGTPDAQWIFTDRTVAVDHANGRTYALTLDDDSPGVIAAAETWLDATTATLRAIPDGGPAPYGAYLRFGETHVTCSAPERFLTIGPAGQMTATPLGHSQEAKPKSPRGPALLPGRTPTHLANNLHSPL